MGTTRRGADMRKHAPSVSVAGLVTVGAMVVALALALDAPAVRMIAALAGCLVLPGLGWARRLRLRDLGDTLALTVVLSLSITAVVATAMAVTGLWSPTAGLAILAAVAAFGFLPVRAVAVRATVVVLGRPSHDEERPRAADLDDTEGGWTDWYADARARSDEESRRREAEAEAAEQEWRDWYAEHHQIAARERSMRWEAADRTSEEPVGADPADTVAPNLAELVTSKGTRD